MSLYSEYKNSATSTEAGKSSLYSQNTDKTTLYQQRKKQKGDKFNEFNFNEFQSNLENYINQYNSLIEGAGTNLKLGYDENSSSFKKQFDDSVSSMKRLNTSLNNDLENYRDILGEEKALGIKVQINSLYTKLNDVSTSVRKQFESSQKIDRYGKKNEMTGQEYLDETENIDILLKSDYAGKSKEDIENRIKEINTKLNPVSDNNTMLSTGTVSSNNTMLNTNTSNLIGVSTPELTDKSSKKSSLSEEERIALQKELSDLEKDYKFINMYDIDLNEYIKYADDYQEMVEAGKEIKDDRFNGYTDTFLGEEVADDYNPLTSWYWQIFNDGAKSRKDYENRAVKFEVTQEEKNNYEYILAKHGKEAAEEYFNELKTNSTEKKAVKQQNKMSEFATEHPILASISGIADNALSLPKRTIGLASDVLSGKDVDTNDEWYRNNLKTIQGTVANSIDSKGLGYLYNAVVSMGQMGAAALMTGGSGVAAYLATDAGTQGFVDAKERGLDNNKALLFGLASGASEYIFEKISIEQLKRFRNMPATSAAGLAKNIAKAIVTEGSEEVATEVSNIIADGLISGDFSTYALNVENYIQQGYSDDEAKSMARKDQLNTIIDSFIVGGMAGGMMGAGANVVGNVQQGSNFKQNTNINNEIQSALEMDTDTEAYQVASKLSEKMENGKTVSNTEAAYLQNAIYKAVQSGQEYINFNEETTLPEGNDTGNIVTNASVKINGEQKTVIGLESTTKTDAVVKFSDGSSAKLSNVNFDDAIIQNVYNMASTFDTPTAKAYINGYNIENDIGVYNKAFLKARKAGMDGVDAIEFARSNMNVLEILGTETLREAYNAGIEVAKNNMSGEQMKVLNAITKATGTTYEMYTANDGINAYIKENGKIHINTTAESPVLVVAAHELTHYMQSNAPATYKAYKGLVIEYLKSNNLEGYNSRLDTLSKLYKNASETELLDEVVANAASDFLLDEKVVKNICNKDKSVAKKVVEAIAALVKKIKAKLSGYTSNSFEAKALRQDLATLEKAKELWTKGMQESSNNSEIKETNTNPSDVKFSLKGIDQNGIEVYEISDEVKNMPFAERKKLFLRKMKNEYKGRTAKFIRNGHAYYAIFDDAGINKAIYGDKKSSKRGSKAKINLGAEGDVFELIENSTYTNSRTEKGKVTSSGIHDNTTFWDYYIKTIRVGNTYYDVLSNVRKADGHYVYDITIKNVPQQKYMTEKSSPLQTPSDVYNNSVSQSNENNNKFSLKETEEVRKLTKENKELKTVVNNLKQQFKLTYGKVPEIAETQQLAKQIIKSVESSYNVDRLASNITKLFKNIKNFEKAGVSTEDAVNITASILKPVLRDSKNFDYGMFDQYEGLRQYLKDTAMSLSIKQKSDIELSYDSFENFRKQMFGSLKLSEDGVSLQEVWNNLSEQYPEFFNANATEIEMIPQILEALEAVKPQYTNPFGYDIDSAAYDMALDLFDQVAKLPSMETFADKMNQDKKKTVDNLKKEYRQSISDVRAAAKADYEVRLRTAKMEMREKMIANNAITRQDTYRKIAEAKAQIRQQTRQNINDRVERTKLRDNINKNAKTLIKWFEKPTDQKYIPDSLKKVTLEMLNSVDFISSRAESDSVQTQVWQNTMRKLKNALIAINESEDINSDVYLMDLDPDFAPRVENFLNSIDGINKISDMTKYQLQEYDYIIKTVKKAITESNVLRANNRYKSIEAIGNDTINHLSNKKDATVVTNKWLNMGRNAVVTDLTDPKNYFHRFGKAGESIFESFAEAQDKRILMLNEAQEYTQEILKGVDVDRIVKTVHEVEIKGKKAQITTAQIMSLYELMKRNQAKEHILKGGFKIDVIEKQNLTGKKIVQNTQFTISEAEAYSLINALSESERQLADEMQEFMAVNCSAWGNAVTQELYEYDKFKDANYFPIETSSLFNKTNDKSENPNSLYRIKNQGFTKQTVNHAKNPIVIRDIFDVYTRHIVGMANYGSETIAMSDAMKWYNYSKSNENEDNTFEFKSVKSEISRTYGDAGLKYFTTLLKDINGEQLNDTASNIPGMLVKNMKVASVAANLRVVIQQPTAYSRALSVIDGKYLTRALASVNLRENAEMAKKHCPMALWKSWGYYDTMLGKSMKETITGIKSLSDKVNDKALWLAGQADELTWGKLWRACELEAKDKNPGLANEEIYKIAGLRLREIIENTQVVDSVLYKPQMSRSSNALIQMELAFMNEPLKTLNMLSRAVASKNKATIIRATTAFTIAAILQSVVKSVMDAARDDDEILSYGEKFFDSMKANLFDDLFIVTYIPYAKSIWNIAQGYDSKRTDMQGMSNLIAGAKKIYGMLANSKGTESYNIYKSSYTILQGLSQLTGIPMSNLMRETKTLYNNVVNTYESITGNKGVKIETQKPEYTSKYEMLYNAILERNQNSVDNIRENLLSSGKSEKDISSALKSKLKEDDRIIEAAEARKKGDLDTYNRIVKEYVALGFSESDIKSVTTSIINKDKEVATSQDAEKKSNYDKYDLMVAINSGNTKNINIIIEDIYNTKLDTGKSRSEAISSVKSMITSAYKETYMMSSETEQSTIRNKLLNIEVAGEKIYSEAEFTKWHEYDYSTSELKVAVSKYDLENAQKIVDYFYETKYNESTGTVASRKTKATSSIKASITAEMKPLYQVASKEDKLKIKQFLRKIKVNGKQLYNREYDFNSWNKKD